MPVFDHKGKETFPPRPISVGDMIGAFLEELGLTVDDLSQRTGLPMPLLQDILACHRILTEEHARLIASALDGLTTQSLLNLQDTYYRHLNALAARRHYIPSFAPLFRKVAVLT